MSYLDVFAEEVTMQAVLPETHQDVEVTCFHCGQPCDEVWEKDGHSFCCVGCRSVYEILSEHNLCTYYDLEKAPGLQLKNIPDTGEYESLNEAAVRKKFLLFDSAEFARAEFFTPAIHCISCIWLLENLHKLNAGILQSKVHFGRKTVTVDFNPQKIQPAQVAALLASVGYAPVIRLQNPADNTMGNDKTLTLKMVVAGFAFGNVMLFSFPEYLGLSGTAGLARLFSWLNVALSLPVFLYSANDYLRSAWISVRQRQINIDVPIALGLIALFFRSVFDIVTGYGPGYLDSFTGLVFFLLVGRWFQQKTYQNLAFDRDYSSFFPLSVYRREQGMWKPVVIYELNPGDVIRIRNMEIIPADSTVLTGEAYVDYSFVTGESRPVKIEAGNLVYAGGRLIGQPVELRVEKKTSQSHLTSLWNHEIFRKPKESRYRRLIDKAAQRFTWIVLFITLAAGVYWYVYDASRVWLIVTSVLVVACPCALALAVPFTLGNMMRKFGHNGFYLKNADVIERLAAVNMWVFDKTGTITRAKNGELKFVGSLSPSEQQAVRQLCSYSTHPMSVLIATHLPDSGQIPVTGFREIPGKGIEGYVNEERIRIGSAAFTGALAATGQAAGVYVSINDEVRGYFKSEASLRNNLKEAVDRWNSPVALLSGDNDTDRLRMRNLLGEAAPLLFNQSPHDKMQYIEKLQNEGKTVLMIGDGLNDAGALKQADVGVAVTDDAGIFTPSCDGILQGDKLGHLDRFVFMARKAVQLVKAGFVLSFTYNAITLTFAVVGKLTPLVAAILMPISSISVVVFATVSVHYSFNRYFNRTGRA
ncbi:MAG: heavy metal translocating P-type ATPase metal-binding domain-containing protein [Cyclobacteriaceae bacterium]|nr:heavy metal translocating P-type ATPase metal-binding domain-containing protein [Cyclobacteriaceae bacterium]MCX7637143.1 heavy metal translocating P-type ATPase metal-binding domain-containing protein [Cyclobacteriaceae bacterium]